MRAYLLAGGLGERLRPLTDCMPKCLVPIRGTPLLGIWLDTLVRMGVDDVLVNVSRFPEQVEAFTEQRSGGPRVHVVRERSPLGSAGTLEANRAFVAGEESFWIVYSDNLTDAVLDPMLTFHRSHGDALTMALFTALDAHSAGIVGLAPDGLITAYEEKPERPASDLANAGLYLARQPLFDWIPPGEGVKDLGYHVLPRLVGRMRGYAIQAFFADIGTPERLARAEAEWPRA